MFIINLVWYFVFQEMEKQVEKGRARSIGLSNFNQEQIQAVYDSAKIKPSNLQARQISNCKLILKIIFNLIFELRVSGRVSCTDATKTPSWILSI